MRYWRTVAAAVMLAALTISCGGGNNGGGGTTGGGTSSSSQDQLNVAAGSTETLSTTDVSVANNATVDGRLESSNGRMVLTVGGNLTVNGTISAQAANPTDPDPSTTLGNLPNGVVLVVTGDVSFGDNASIQANGPVVITDDSSVLNRTLADVFDEADTASGDLPTLIPLPPDDPAFARSVDATPGPIDRQALRNVNIGGNWNLSGLRGDRPVTVFRFNGQRNLNLNNWTLTGPNGVNGASSDNTAGNDQGKDSKGADGKRGMNVNIWNNGGPVNINGNVVLNLPSGGNGGDASAVCAKATGGEGGKAGNLRITGSGGINLANGTLTINPGRGGNGGSATVTGLAGAAGCPGAKGCDAIAEGGKGGENKKRLLVRGNVAGVANITVGNVVGGSGGNATATAGDGGPGNNCCDGGDGGKGTATGGAGGEASLNVGGLAVTAAGATGGVGGNATASGGKGGKGGDCKFAAGGKGGKGGDAQATGGAGGNATATGGGSTSTGGAGGSATATGGNGGNGGNSAVLVGAGGAGGNATATAGAGGSGQSSGAAGQINQTLGNPGAPGNPLQIKRILCFGFAFIANGSVSPGVQTGPTFPPDSTTANGQMNIEFRNIPGAEYAKQNTPSDHIGIGGPGQLDVLVNTANPAIPTNTPVAGIELVPLFGSGISQSNPLQVQALGSGGTVIDTQTIGTIPNNSSPQNAQTCTVLFNNQTNAQIQIIRIIAPNGSFFTMFQFYLLDP